MMDYKEILEKCKERYGEKVYQPEGKEEFWFSPEILLDLFQFIKTETEYQFLLDITAVDYPDSFQMVYHLMDLTDASLLKLCADLDKNEPKILSLCPVWKAANVMEREVFDLMGIMFEDHPNLKRILCPDDFEGYPLRKDYILPPVARR